MNFDPNNPMFMQMMMNSNQFNMGGFPMNMMNPNQSGQSNSGNPGILYNN